MVFPGAGDHSGFHPLLSILIMNDAGLTDARGNPDFLNPRVTEALRFINTLYVNGYIPDGVPGYRSSDSERVYQSGRAAMSLFPMLDLSEFPEVDANSAVMPAIRGPSATIGRNYAWVNAIGGYSQTRDADRTRSVIRWLVENEGGLWEAGRMTSLPARASLRELPYFNNNWQTRQVNELVMPTAATPVHPASSIYLAWSVIEAELVPMNALVLACAPNPNYAAIQQDIQNWMIRAWAEFNR